MIGKTARGGFDVAASPHIRRGTRLSHLLAGRALALLPVFAAALYFHGARVLLHIMTAVFASVAADAAASFLFHRKGGWRNGYSLYTGLLIGLLVPEAVPAAGSLILVFAVCFFFRDAFGPAGSSPLLEAALAGLILQTIFPAWVPGSGEGTTLSLLLGNHSGFPALTPVGFILFSGILLLAMRLIYWEIPLLYLAGYSLLWGLSGQSVLTPLLARGAVFTAFFLLTEPAASPVTRRAFSYAAVTGGVAAFLFEELTSLSEGGFAAILLVNFMTPWFDRWIRPANLRPASA